VCFAQVGFSLNSTSVASLVNASSTPAVCYAQVGCAGSTFGAILAIACFPSALLIPLPHQRGSYVGLLELTVRVNRFGARPAEVRAQARDGIDLSAHNPAKK